MTNKYKIFLLRNLLSLSLILIIFLLISCGGRIHEDQEDPPDLPDKNVLECHEIYIAHDNVYVIYCYTEAVDNDRFIDNSNDSGYDVK